MEKLIPSSEYNPYYKGYIERYDGKPIIEALVAQKELCSRFFNEFPVDKSEYRYEEGKWTPKEIFLHINDTERVMAYRALRFSRNDLAPLVGFEQDDYVEHGAAADRTIQDLQLEFDHIRSSTISLFQHLPQGKMTNIGTASDSPISVRALGYIILGHVDHHYQIIKERYL